MQTPRGLSSEEDGAVHCLHSNHTGQYLWRRLARSDTQAAPIDPVLGRYKAQEFLRLIAHWLPDLRGRKILKTDLREEAYGEDQILFSPALRKGIVYAVDIAEEAVAAARRRQRGYAVSQVYLCGDVRRLPFGDGIFDMIISTSTLDHFTVADDFHVSLRELRRVLKQGGTMILAVNNGLNVNYHCMLRVGSFLGMIPYPVQFYVPADLRRQVATCGWAVEEQEFIVHIISPASTLLKTARKILPRSLVDRIAKKFVALSCWLGGRRKSRWLTGWFIVLKCCPRAQSS